MSQPPVSQPPVSQPPPDTPPPGSAPAPPSPSLPRLLFVLAAGGIVILGALAWALLGPTSVPEFAPVPATGPLSKAPLEFLERRGTQVTPDDWEKELGKAEERREGKARPEVWNLTWWDKGVFVGGDPTHTRVTLLTTKHSRTVWGLEFPTDIETVKKTWGEPVMLSGRPHGGIALIYLSGVYQVTLEFPGDAKGKAPGPSSRVEVFYLR